MDQMVSQCGMRSKESIKTGNEKENFNLSARACERTRDEEKNNCTGFMDYDTFMLLYSGNVFGLKKCHYG